MSKFFTDLREFPAGTYLTDNYIYETATSALISIWEKLNADFTVSLFGAGTGNKLKFTATTDRHSAVIWTRPGILSGTMECLSAAFFTGVTNKKDTGLGICLGGEDGTEDGYVAYFSNDSVRGVGLALDKIVAGSVTELGEDTTFTPAVDQTQYYIRVKRDAAKVYAKGWKVVDTEPVGWMIEVADTTFLSGYMGFYSYSTAVNHYGLTLSVGTDGDPPVYTFGDLTPLSTPDIEVNVNGDRAQLTPDIYPEPEGIPISAIQYQVTLATDPTFSSPVIDDGEETEESKFVTKWVGLSTFTSYIARVRRETKYGDSGYSIAAPFETEDVATLFYTDFSDYPDIEIPAGWLIQATGKIGLLNNFDYYEICNQIITDYGFVVGYGEGTLGDARLQRCSLAIASTERRVAEAQTALEDVVYWDWLWDEPPAIPDGEIYARLRGQHGAGIVFRAGFRTGYVVKFHVGQVRLDSHSSDGIATIGFYTFPDSQGSLYQYDWYNIRIRFIGTAIKFKVWQYRDIEPIAWSVEETDLLWSTGRVGISCTGNRLLSSGFDCLAVEASGSPSGPFPYPLSPPGGIDTPEITDCSVDTFGNASFESSDFSGDASAAHINTRWQVDLSTGDFSDPVVDTQYEIRIPLTEMVIPTLPPETYKARVLYRDSYEQESSWSAAFPFSVTAREDPVDVELFQSLGDIWSIEDLSTNFYFGLLDGSWSSEGPGGSGSSTRKVYYDSDMGRECERILLLGTSSGYQAVKVEGYGIDFYTLLSPNTPKVPFVYIVEDMVKSEHIPVYWYPQNPDRACFTGVHKDQGMNFGPVNGGHEYSALGFRVKKEENWKAYLTSYWISGGGALIKNVDTGIAHDEIFRYRIECDGWNKQIRWYVENELITSRLTQVGDVAHFGPGGRVNGVWAKGAHAFHVKAHPIQIAYRAVEQVVIP